MMASVDTCSLCPRLCRHGCPVATGAGREAAVPTVIAGVLYDHKRGLASDDLATRAATLCTDCGACQEVCHIHEPLPQALRHARAALLTPPELPPLPAFPAPGRAVALQSAPGDLAAWCAERQVIPVTCPNRLGLAALEFPVFERRAASLRASLLGRSVWTQDGGIAKVLESAEISFSWCATDDDAVGSCVCSAGQRPPLACCGAGGTLARHHPDDARRLAHAFARRLPQDAHLLDQRCVRHLQDSGVSVNGVWGPPLGESS